MAPPDDPARPPDTASDDPDRAARVDVAAPAEGGAPAPDAAARATDAPAVPVTSEPPAVDEPATGRRRDRAPSSHQAPSSQGRAKLLTSPDTLCRNCGEALPGAYCPGCGQKAGPLRQPAHHFVRDAFLEFFGIDGRFWPTFWALLVKPGRLTQEYLAGRRQTYLRPLRVYLVSTLFFFFLLSLIDPASRMGDTVFQSSDLSDSVRVADQIARLDSLLDPAMPALDNERAEVAEARQAVGRSAPGSERSAAQATLKSARLELEGDSLGLLEDRPRRELQRAVLATLPPDSLIVLDGLEGAANLIYPDSSSFFSGEDESWLIRNEALSGMSGAPTDAQRRQNLIRFLRSAIGQVPTVLFLILPIFALLLKVLYARRGWYYSEHLIFGLHTHAFAFLVFCLVTLGILALTGMPGGAGRSAVGWMVVALLVTIPIYFYIAQKRVYGQGWIKTAVKAILLAFAYNAVLMVGLGGAFAIAAFFG